MASQEPFTDFYQLLGLGITCTSNQILDAFNTKDRIIRRNGTIDTGENNPEYNLLKLAANTLLDPPKRAEYDEYYKANKEAEARNVGSLRKNFLKGRFERQQRIAKGKDGEGTDSGEEFASSEDETWAEERMIGKGELFKGKGERASGMIKKDMEVPEAGKGDEEWEEVKKKDGEEEKKDGEEEDTITPEETTA